MAFAPKGQSRSKLYDWGSRLLRTPFKTGDRRHGRAKDYTVSANAARRNATSTHLYPYATPRSQRGVTIAVYSSIPRDAIHFDVAVLFGTAPWEPIYRKLNQLTTIVDARRRRSVLRNRKNKLSFELHNCHEVFAINWQLQPWVE
jgi:hypothetical protein